MKMSIAKNRIAVILAVMILIVALTACVNTPEPNEISNKEELNDKAKLAYSEVLDQYKDAAELSWKEYKQKKDEYPLVCSQAMNNYTGSGYLYYAYYDLNGDGLDELMIGSDWDVHGYDPVTSDIFVYNDGQMYSVLDSRFKDADEFATIYDPTVYRNNVIRIGITTDYSEETWFLKLNDEGTSLETVDYLNYKEGKYYQGRKTITEQEYRYFRNQFKDYDSNFEGHEENDIPYLVLISNVEGE